MIILGLNSGTSRDSVSAVIFETGQFKAPMKIQLYAHSDYAYPAWLEKELVKLEHQPSLEHIARMNFLLGEFFAQCALRLIKESGISSEKIDLIASHGQTIGHFPALKKIHGYSNRASLQIAEPCVIALRTGITTIGDFRSADIAGYGQGAPVLTYPEYLLFFSPEKNRMALNLGGIANFSLIPKTGQLGKIRASDCGPCNMLLDGLSRAISRGRLKFDPQGRMALRGEPREKWIRAWLKHPFFKKPAPKTTGRDEFDASWLKGILRGQRIKSQKERADLLRSGVCAVAEMVAQCYFDNYGDFGMEEVIVSGGGSKNQALILELTRRLGRNLILSDAIGVPALAKEPIGFGILAQLCVLGKAGNIPSATGAKAGAVLGKICPGKNWRRLIQGLGLKKEELR